MQLLRRLFLLLVLLIVLGSAIQWWQLIRGTKPVVLRESEFVPAPQVLRRTFNSLNVNAHFFVPECVLRAAWLEPRWVQV